jgi:hypothetical protein
MASKVSAKMMGFGGGANLRDAPNQLAGDEALGLNNVLLDERGGASKRLGALAHGTFGVSVDRIISSYVFYRGSSAPHTLIQTSAGRIYFSTDPNANPQVWTLMTSSVSGTDPMSWETFGGAVWFSNATNGLFGWDGSTLTAYPAAPKLQFLRIWKDTLWGNGLNGDRVYSSLAGDPTNWPAANWVDIAKGDGDRCMGIHTDGTFLIVFKQRRHWVVYDPVTFGNRLVDYEKGCEGHFSIINHEGKIFFLSRRGVCVFLGDSPAELISGKIDPIFDPVVLNINALNTAWAYTVGNRVAWALPEVGQSAPSFQAEFYPRLEKTPWTFHRMPGRTFTRVRSGSYDKLFIGSNAANKLLESFGSVGDDDGVAFGGFAQKSWTDFGQPALTKYLRRARILGRGRFNVQFKRNYQTGIDKTFPVDLSSTSDVWSVADIWGGTWGPQSVFQEKRLHPDYYGREFSIIFSDAETGYGRRSFDLAGLGYTVDAGQWGAYGAVFDAEIMGVRD